MGRRWWMWRTVALGVSALLFVEGAHARVPQEGRQGESAPDRTRARVTGRVVDAETTAPLAGSMVILEPISGGVLPPGAGQSAFLARSWTAMTDRSGSYVFEEVSPGRYRLRVARIGYKPRSVELELRRADPINLSVALTINPIPLEPVAATAPPPAPYGVDQTRGAEIEVGRVAAVRHRQNQFLSTDVRTLTHADVVEAVTLGETDVFRAVQRLPGVAARDDFAAQPWVRGAPSDHTRTYFDGMPLFNPFNGFGLLSGVGPEVLGAVFLQPGVRSASVGEGAAAVIEMSSRPAGAEEVRGFGELSLASARLSVDRRIGDRAGIMVGVRRSYADALADLIGSLADDPEIVLPYAFHNLVGRLDYQLDDQRALNVSGLWQQDRVFGDIPDVTVGNSGRWGNALAQATVSTPLFGLSSRHSLGITRFRSDVRLAPPDTNLGFSAPTARPEISQVVYVSLSGAFESPAATLSVPSWRFGYQAVWQDVGFGGPTPNRWPAFGAAPRYARRRTTLTSQLGYGALWGERRWRIGPATVEAGARLELGPEVRNGGAARFAPRLTARFDLASRLTASVGVGRNYQYTQVLDNTGIEVAEGLQSGSVWLLAGDTIPALRADIVQGGLEWWLADRWLASINGHARRTTGLILFDPTPGGPGNEVRVDSLFVTGSGLARGVELSLRRLAGRWTASASYGYTVSTTEAAGLRFASSADGRHTLSLTTMIRAGRSVRLGTTYRYASGFPFTRFQSASGEFMAPNAQRAPSYASADFLFDWNHAWDAWSLGFFLQVRNVFNRDNRSGYEWTDFDCVGGRRDSLLTPPQCDHFQDGLPIFPVIGFRVSF